ncbi:MAG: hypothetical protein AB7T49_12585 [Oligoflexales bacterium]
MNSTFHKSLWINKNVNSLVFAQTLDIVLDFEPILQIIKKKPRLYALHIDLCYCVFRHKNWIGSALFQSFLTNHLNQEHEIPQAHATELIMLLIDFLHSSNIMSKTTQRSDEQFIKYIFVSAIVSKADSMNGEELGFGSFLVEYLRKTARDIQSNIGSTTKDTIVFSTEVESMIQNVFYAFSDQMKVTPWIIDVYHLLFGLEGHVSDEFLTETDVGKVFYLLLEIGKARTLSIASVKSKAKKLGINFLAPDELMESLYQANLVYRDGKGKTGHWRLTREAEKLTANAFAHQVFRNSSQTKDNLSLNPAYQGAIFARLSEEHKEILLELFTKDIIRVFPENMESGINRLLKFFDTKQVMEMLLKTAKDLDRPWLERAIFTSLVQIKDQIAPELKGTEQSDDAKGQEF